MSSRPNQLSGGPINRLKKGWALIPFDGERSHFWIEDTATMEPLVGKFGRVRYYRSACGLLATVYRVLALHEGSFLRCKNCVRADSNKIVTTIEQIKAYKRRQSKRGG